MVFITTDSKLFVEGEMVKQQRLPSEAKRNLFIYVFFFLFISNVLYERVQTAQQTGAVTKWISVAIYAIILLGYLGIFFDFLFRKHWGNRLQISKIERIRTYPSDEGLETHVVLTLRSKRRKLFKFRTLEKQAETFVDEILSRSPSIELQTSAG